MGDQAPSIRVETDFSAGTDGDRPEDRPGEPSNRRRSALFGALAVLAVVVVALIALRPETGTAADGSERAIPTTTTVPVDEVGDAPEAEVRGPLTAEVVDNSGSLLELVNAPVGYLGVNNLPAPRAAPSIVRSIDGVAWTDVEAEVVESNDFDLVRSRFASFIGLGQTEDGFSILRARQELSEPGRTSTGRFIVDRLVSEQGSVWMVDEAFGDLTTRQAFPFTTSAGDLVLGVGGPFPTTAADLVPDGFGSVIEQALTGLDCSPRGSSLDLLFIEDCDPVTEQPLCPSGYLTSVERGTDLSEFLLVEPEGPTAIYSASGLLTAPHVIETETGSNLVIAMAVPIPIAPTECEGSDEVVDPRPPGVFVWEAPGEPQFVPLSNLETGLTEADLARVVAIGTIRLGPLGESLVVATPDQLLLISAEGDVRGLQSLDDFSVSDWVPAVSENSAGLALIDIRDGVFRRWQVTNDGSTFARIELVAEQVGVGEVRFADDDVIILRTTRGDRAIRLNPTG